jgi:hypothetical protein
MAPLQRVPIGLIGRDALRGGDCRVFTGASGVIPAKAGTSGRPAGTAVPGVFGYDGAGLSAGVGSRKEAKAR